MCNAVNNKNIISCIYSSINTFNITFWSIWFFKLQIIKIKVICIISDSSIFSINCSNFTIHFSSNTRCKP